MKHLLENFVQVTLDYGEAERRSMLLRGTSENIGKHVAALVEQGINGSLLAVTFRPVTAANVWKIDDEGMARP